jgi:hypothetical protein
MADEIPELNPPLTREEKLAIAHLTESDLKGIDAAILNQADEHWLKVARVVTCTHDALRPHHPNLSYRFYTKRLAVLLREGRLEAKGDIRYVRFSEVRISKRWKIGRISMVEWSLRRFFTEKCSFRG